MTAHAESHDAHSRLDDLRTAALRRVATLVNSFDDIVESSSDVATDDEHDPEGHTIAWERQQIAARLDEAQMTLAEIDAAVRRLDAGDYGVCTVCGNDVAPQRLEALPATATCTDCAR